jgi:hypothetical protein
MLVDKPTGLWSSYLAEQHEKTFGFKMADEFKAIASDLSDAIYAER